MENSKKKTSEEEAQSAVPPVQKTQQQPQYLTVEEIYEMMEYQAMYTNPGEFWRRQRG